MHSRKGVHRSMSRHLKGWVRPRPVRVAFLVQDGEHAQLALDGIFADCYYRWGGRFSLIVPCQEFKIPENYWPWLEAYDADIFYSYVPLTEAAILELHERLSPGLYKFHGLGREPRLDVHGFKPSYGFAPLSSLSLIFWLARYRSSAPGAPIKIIDSWYTDPPSRFISDNYGTYHVSHGGGMFPVDAATAATLLTIVAPEKRGNRRFGVPPTLDAVPDEATAFKAFVDGSATSLSLASTILAPKLDIQNARWSSSFNLVVGDSFDDRVTFWNGRLFIPTWLDTDLCCARVTLTSLQDPIFLATLGELIKRRNHVNAGSGGQPQLTIRSASLTSVELEEAKALLLRTAPWSFVVTEAITSLDALVPSPKDLKNAREGSNSMGSLMRQTGWKPFDWSPPIARPPSTAPEHIADVPSQQFFTQGYWAEELILEQDGPHTRMGQENIWQLPRRWRMSESFLVKLVGDGRAELPRVRRSRDGNLTVYANTDRAVESITVPSAIAAVDYALAADGRWAKQVAASGEILPGNKVVWARRSNEARYLAGVLGMAEGLTSARKALMHPFLREQFALLGGTPNVPADKVSPTIARLKSKARRNPNFDLTDDNETAALAELIVKAGREQKNPRQFVSYEKLKADWKAHREAYWARNQKPTSTEPDDDWDKREEESLDAALIGMRRRQILFQGHQWVCRTCHHRNWVDLAALSAQLTCEVCKRVDQAPVDIRWMFRPNEFLIESLRDHSILSLLWLLGALSDRARRSFLFVPPTCFGFTEDEEHPSAEIDLMAIVDGNTLLCEVKSSWRFKPIELTELVNLAVRLRPDVAVLAVMERGTGQTGDLEAARAILATHDIRFEVLTPENVRDDDYVYLDID